MRRKRSVDLVVLSDIHLGTYGCHAKELLRYMKSIRPKQVILNGDIVDIWQFSKRYWPKSHMKVIKRLLQWTSEGVPVYYVTGNHDEMLRKFSGFELGSFQIVNKVVLDLEGKKAWFFHGDVFDVTMQHSKWLARLGAIGYDTLILINRAVNYLSAKMGRGKISMSKRIKNSVKSAVKFIGNFEQTAADIAIENGYDYVVCGHIHQPEIRQIRSEKGEVTYLNSGDWIENLTSLEYHRGKWRIYSYEQDLSLQAAPPAAEQEEPLDLRLLQQQLIHEFQLKA
ncbi:UDP-2,3-diacylglucosamine pyrophosphatase LpxH [Robiginitalea myxolifaciens]|uniref:UDP-2,3-diacylglucosamine pyrophosphatase LpxH n=1 Tax=Robiginitalea myxolifaciens TaxID=400055 RepID=A0A1I6GAS3_9FLAO|nr:UDP-2,3-diacylglucosamine diphosphatase [Robiginitalea myxolifaciens]SFR39167.1 UDP-2,3-diacylglucosamine pyrophosphatase LpxH [Robiginitalea myxolifaciens]